ncbi:MAG TPA: zinc ABC transporter substrate-binding protein [Bacillota bacterium]
MVKVQRVLWVFVFLLMAVQINRVICAVEQESIPVFVSILPQKYFVERIGGQAVQVSVMVGPGQSPATYEPLPKQMSELTRAALYFSIGVPFEDAWLKKFTAAAPNMKVINTRAGITLRKMDRYSSNLAPTSKEQQGKRREHHHHHDRGLDPHIWLDPMLVKKQAKTIYQALVELRPEKEVYFSNNLQKFLTDLDAVHLEIKEAFSGLTNKKLLVFHPAWGYFCDRYGLTQVPIEMEGKEPGPRELGEIIEFAKEEGIKVVFVQAQFSSKQAETVAKAVNGKVVLIDPLAEDYLNNLKSIARVMREELM